MSPAEILAQFRPDRSISRESLEGIGLEVGSEIFDLVPGLIRVSGAQTDPCLKDRRVAALIAPNGSIIGTGTNHLPRGMAACNGSCSAVCGRVAIHAEEAALRVAPNWSSAEMVHLALDVVRPVGSSGETVLIPRPSGPPRCIQCSGIMLDAGVAALWLLHDTGADGLLWARWPMLLAHRVGLINCGTDAFPG